MAEYLIQDSTLEDIADAIRAKTGDSGLINPEDMADEIDGLATVTDGIVVKTRDASGNPSEVDFYGSIVNDFQFGFNGYGDRCNPFSLVSKVNFKSAVSNGLTRYAFRNAVNLKSLVIPENVVFIMGNGFANLCNELETVSVLSQSRIEGYSAFASNPKLKTFYAPKITHVDGASSALTYAVFVSCPLLESVQFGSVGYGVTFLERAVFNNDQSELTITVYTTASYVDTFVTKIRNGATAATIIIKASEDTTYNNVSYTAGDTIVTSVPETTE